MRICLIKANLMKIDGQSKLFEKQVMPTGWHLEEFEYNDENYPLRINALTPRLQSKIPKMLGYEMHPGYDIYIWMDGSIQVHSEATIQYLVEGLSNKDIFLFNHPKRKTIVEECQYVISQINNGNEYLKRRYEFEPMQAEVNLYLSDTNFKDENLFAGGCFVYSKKIIRKDFFKDWFFHACRYSIQDQLSLPYLLSKHEIEYSCSIYDIRKNPYFEIIPHG